MTERIEGTRHGAPEQHVVQFYDDEAILIEQIWNFISPALTAGDAVIVIATRAHLARLEQKLARHRWSGGMPLNAEDQYVALDAAQTLSRIMLNGELDESLFRTVVGSVVAQASERGFARVRAYGEMVTLLCADQNEEAAIRLEHLWNTLVDRHPLSLLCTYPVGAFCDNRVESAFERICNAHTHVRSALTLPTAGGDANLQRTIATLQQKAATLESEVARRQKIEQVLQRRELELSDFLENAPEGMHRVGPDGTIVWANKAELTLLGYAREEYISHNIVEFHVDADVIEDILARLRHGEALYDYPARMRHKDGSVRHVLIHSNSQVVEGEFVSTRCLMRDVTDRVRLEEELNRKLQEMAEIDRRKDEFLAMLGHELRNPLAPIMTSVELMRLRAGDAEMIAQWRETIARQAHLMARLVDDLLDVSRITRGKIELKPERITLGYIVERAVEIVRPLIDERGHELTLDLTPEPVRLYGDPARLAQVLANLLHNAAKYTPRGGHISLNAQASGKQLKLRIADDGVGLDQALRDKVFELFIQGSGSLPDARGGLGIGLTLVRSLVELHGGEVEARSEGPGCGSEFLITLPLDTTAGEARAPDTTASPGSARSGASRVVMIVDDNIDAAESLGEFLKACGHCIHIAHDGPAAIAAATQSRPDVVILDIGMPAMDGYEVAHCLRSQLGLASSMLIAVTGYARERDRISAWQAGFDYHFAKPLDIDRLLGVIKGN